MSSQKEQIEKLPEVIKSRIVKRGSVSEEGQEKPRNFSQERFDALPEAIKALVVKRGASPKRAEEQQPVSEQSQGS